MRIISFIIMTFVVAICYGFFLTTENFMRPNFDPVTSGHQAADNVYNLFGLINNEVKRNDSAAPALQPHHATIAYKIARPYAVTADLSAILGGKLEVRLSLFAHNIGTHS